PPYGPAACAGAPPGVPEAVRARRAADPVTWWRAYVERVVPPVLDADADHGVVLEPHLQNVLIGVDADALPAEVIFRDLEGTKLVAGRHDLSGLPARVAAALTYEPERGWNRMAYCLVVNHLAERSEEHTSELQSRENLVCRLLLEKKKQNTKHGTPSVCD